MPTHKITLPKDQMYSFAVPEGTEVVVKVLGSQVEYGENLIDPKEGVIKHDHEMTFTSSAMLRSKSGSEIEITHPDVVGMAQEEPVPLDIEDEEPEEVSDA